MLSAVTNLIVTMIRHSLLEKCYLRLKNEPNQRICKPTKQFHLLYEYSPRLLTTSSRPEYVSEGAVYFLEEMEPKRCSLELAGGSEQDFSSCVQEARIY